jgi:preprotein translocase subunit SecB
MAMEMKIKPTQLADNFHEVILEFRLEAKVAETVVYLVELQQAGLFMIRGVGPDDLRRLLGTHCPHILLPFARQAISDLITKGGFPPFLLPPMDFAAMMQAQEQQALAQQNGGAPAVVN